MSEPLNILILEDDSDDAELMAAALREDGLMFEWQIATSREDYLAHLSADLDLILEDYTLSGFDAPAALQLLEESGLDVPFIVISGTVSEEEIVALMKQGAADYLLKDRLTRLGESARRALKERELHREKQQAEAALLASEARFRRLAENAPDIIYRWRVTEPMGFEYVSPVVESILGYSPETFYENTNFLLDIVHPDDRDLMRQMLTGGRPHEPVTVRMRRSDGATVWLERRSAPVITEKGDIIASEGIIRDITERKQMEEALRESRARLQAIFDNAQDAILLADDAMHYVGANPAACKLLGYERDELLALTVVDIAPNTSHEAMQRQWDQFIADGSMGGEYVVQHRDGSLITADFRAVANIEPGVHLSVIRDVSERKEAEEALRRSERRFRQLFEAAPIPLLMVNAADGTVLHANERFAAAMGTSRQELSGQSGMGLPGFHEMDMPIEQIAAQKPVRDYELHVRRGENGRGMWLLFSSEPIMLKEGPALLASFQNITPLKEAQQAERAQREFAEALAANALDIHRTLSLEETLNRILDNVKSVIAFDAASILLVEGDKVRYGARYRSEEMSAIPDLLEGYDLKDLTGVQLAMESGEPLLVADVADYEGWRAIPGGEWIRSFISAPILLDGRAIGVLGVASRRTGAFSGEDVAHMQAFSAQAATAIVNARLFEELEEYSSILEEAVQTRTTELERAKEQAESILHNSPDPILLLETDGRIRTGNRAFQHLFGHDVDELHGHTPMELVAPEQQEVLARALQASLRQIQPVRLEVRAIDADNAQFDTHLSLSPIGRGHSVSGIVCSFHDISALKEVQRMKDQFVSTATHELRTPLTSVKGFSELLLTRDLDAKRQRRYITLIHEQATHLALIIDDMLDLSKLAAQKGLEIEPQAVDMGALIRSVLDTFRDVSPTHTFRVEGCEGLPTLPGDPFRLNQVLRNLVSNAVKYSPNGGAVTVECTKLEVHLLISVSDEGVGMTDEEQSHLFEEFYRTDHAIPGTGLGLRISQLIVLGHGGWMWAESEHGKGSTFFFILPLKE